MTTPTLDQQRAPLAKQHARLTTELHAAEEKLTTERRALAKGGGTAAKVAEAQSIVSALTDALADVSAELQPIDAEIAAHEAAQQAAREHRENVERAVELSKATRKTIDEIGAARAAALDGLRTMIAKRHEVQTRQGEFLGVLRALGGDKPAVCGELAAAGADLGAVNTTMRFGDSTPLSHRTAATLLRFDQPDAVAALVDELVGRLALAN